MIKFSCHCHYVILLDIATVCCDILCNTMIPHALYVHSQPSSSVIHVYINAQMVITMLNEILLGLLMIITEYLMLLLILMKLIAVNSLHRDYMEMNGVEMVILPCAVM